MIPIKTKNLKTYAKTPCNVDQICMRFWTTLTMVTSHSLDRRPISSGIELSLSLWLKSRDTREVSWPISLGSYNMQIRHIWLKWQHTSPEINPFLVDNNLGGYVSVKEL